MPEAIPLRWLQRLPESVDVNVVLEDWTWESGALRVLPGRHFYEVIPTPTVKLNEVAYPSNLTEEVLLYDSLRSQLFPLKKGTVIIRDVNTLHGGCPNLSARHRLMPSFIFEPLEWTEMRNTMMDKREWSWLPRFWGWPQVKRDQVPNLNRKFAAENKHLLPASCAKMASSSQDDDAAAAAADDNDWVVWSHSGSRRWADRAFGFDAERLQRMVSDRLSYLDRYKRRDEDYNHNTWIRADLEHTAEQGMPL